MKCIYCKNDMRLDDEDISQHYIDYYYVCDNCEVSCCRHEVKKEIWIDRYGEIINIKGVQQ